MPVANPKQLPTSEEVNNPCERASNQNVIFDDNILLARANITKDVMFTLLNYTGSADSWCDSFIALSARIDDAEKYAMDDPAGDSARYELRCALYVIDERICCDEIGYGIDADHYHETLDRLQSLRESKNTNAKAYIEKLETFAGALKLQKDHRVSSLDLPYEYELFNIIHASYDNSSNPANYPVTKVITPPPVVQPPSECQVIPSNNSFFMCFLPVEHPQTQTVNSIANSNASIALRIAQGFIGAGLLVGMIALFKPTLFNPLIRKGKSLFDNVTSGNFGLFSPQVDYTPVSTKDETIHQKTNRIG